MGEILHPFLFLSEYRQKLSIQFDIIAVKGQKPVSDRLYAERKSDMDREEGRKIDRILSIYTMLIEGKVVNKAEMARRFDVNARSIQRDMECIRRFLEDRVPENGIRKDLVYDYGKKGYRLKQPEERMLTNEEVLAVCKILLDSRAFIKQEMTGILDRLVSCSIPRKNQKMVNELLSNEKFHYIEPHHGKRFLDKMWEIGQAIRESRIIRISYQKMKNQEQVSRRLEPLAILFSEYYFYLVGFIENIDRKTAFQNADDPYPTIYRIDRIDSLQVLPEHFKIPYADRFEEGEFRKRVQFMYGGRLQKLRFEYKGPSVEAVLDRLPTAKILREEDGSYLIQAEVFGKGVEMWLKSQGNMVKDVLIKEL